MSSIRIGPPRRSSGIVRARAWYGVGLGNYPAGNLFMILRRNLPIRYRAVGARFSISHRATGVIFKNKQGLFFLGEIGE